MNSLELLEDEACKDGIDIIQKAFKSKRIKGLYCDKVVAINKELETSTEKKCILLEELGHHYTSSGDILDLSIAQNRKQERQARIWAYNKQIGLKGLINAYEHGCRNKHEIAEYLEVTESFLQEAVNCYKEKYGIFTQLDNYIIYFQPLGILSLKETA
jgi:hypothetical protein